MGINPIKMGYHLDKPYVFMLIHTWNFHLLSIFIFRSIFAASPHSSSILCISPLYIPSISIDLDDYQILTSACRVLMHMLETVFACTCVRSKQTERDRVSETQYTQLISAYRAISQW